MWFCELDPRVGQNNSIAAIKPCQKNFMIIPSVIWYVVDYIYTTALTIYSWRTFNYSPSRLASEVLTVENILYHYLSFITHPYSYRVICSALRTTILHATARSLKCLTIHLFKCTDQENFVLHLYQCAWSIAYSLSSIHFTFLTLCWPKALNWI